MAPPPARIAVHENETAGLQPLHEVAGSARSLERAVGMVFGITLLATG